jgi:redox-regulated HSP33 family molecular chaperone
MQENVITVDQGKLKFDCELCKKKYSCEKDLYFHNRIKHSPK